jgi:hypothetical protein
MDAQFVGKKVPWPQLEEYITVHKNAIEACLSLEKIGWTRETIETLLPKLFWTIYQTVTKIINDNKIAP